MFVSQVEEAIPGISETEVEGRKEKHFVKWLKSQVLYLIKIKQSLVLF